MSRVAIAAALGFTAGVSITFGLVLNFNRVEHQLEMEDYAPPPAPTFQTVRLCPDGVSKIIATQEGDRYLIAGGPHPSLTPVDPATDPKDLC